MGTRLNLLTFLSATTSHVFKSIALQPGLSPRVLGYDFEEAFELLSTVEGLVLSSYGLMKSGLFCVGIFLKSVK